MKITGRTDLYGVIGYPIKHSLSPVFQNAAFSHLGINAVYIPFEIKPENLPIALEGLMQGKKVLVLGAGGASRAIIYALNRADAEVFLWNRTKQKAEELARCFKVGSPTHRKRLLVRLRLSLTPPALA